MEGSTDIGIGRTGSKSNLLFGCWDARDSCLRWKTLAAGAGVIAASGGTLVGLVGPEWTKVLEKLKSNLGSAGEAVAAAMGGRDAEAAVMGDTGDAGAARDTGETGDSGRAADDEGLLEDPALELLAEAVAEEGAAEAEDGVDDDVAAVDGPKFISGRDGTGGAPAAAVTAMLPGRGMGGLWLPVRAWKYRSMDVGGYRSAGVEKEWWRSADNMVGGAGSDGLLGRWLGWYR